MKKFKENLRCVLVALIIEIPLYIMLYGLMINNPKLALNSLMTMLLWAPLVLWLDSKIDEYFNK